jgi:hypothetical protein
MPAVRTLAAGWHRRREEFEGDALAGETRMVLRASVRVCPDQFAKATHTVLRPSLGIRISLINMM